MNNKFTSRRFLIVISVGLVAILLVAVWFSCAVNRIYETNRISNYGEFDNNRSSKYPVEFIESFFPEKIDDSFSDITYHFKTVKGDQYAFEAYLEFVIEDPEDFNLFLKDTVDQSQSVVFSYDNTFMEYTIDDALHLSIRNPQERTCTIQYANYGKILYSLSEQRFIFVAIGMLDGGGADTVELGYFFTRFNIDPRDCATSI